MPPLPEQALPPLSPAKQIYRNTFLIGAMILALLICGALLWLYRGSVFPSHTTQTLGLQTQEVSTTTASGNAPSLAEATGTQQDILGTQPDNLVIIYSTEIGNMDSTNGNYDVAIWQKIGNAQPELETIIGTTSESEYKAGGGPITPDHKYLLIDLENKLQLLDLKTKELRTIFVPDRIVGGTVAFSPDGTHIAVGDGNEYFGGYPFDDTSHVKSALYSVELATGKKTLLYEDAPSIDGPQFADVFAWRPDNNIIVGLSGRANQTFSYVNVTDHTRHPFEDSEMANPSPSGRYAVLYKDVVHDSCSDNSSYEGMPDFGYSAFNIIDPISGTITSSVIRNGDILSFMDYSPDESHILYSVRSATTCDKSNTGYVQKYYTQNLKAHSEPVLVSNPQTVYASWDIPAVDTNIQGHDNEGINETNYWHMNFNGKPVLGVRTHNLSIITSYYR